MAFTLRPMVSGFSAALSMLGASSAVALVAAPAMASEASAEGPEPGSQRQKSERLEWQRRVELGIAAGPVLRPASEGGIEYGLGLGLGGYVRPRILPWLHVRGALRHEFIPASVESGAFDAAGTTTGLDLEQPTLGITAFELSVEPTWVIHPRWSVFGSLGVGWVRLAADAPRGSDFEWEATRTAVEVDVLFGGGVTFELVPGWAVLGADVGYGVAFDQRGSAYEPLQVVIDGQVEYLAPLPAPSGVVDVLLTFGILL